MLLNKSHGNVEKHAGTEDFGKPFRILREWKSIPSFVLIPRKGELGSGWKLVRLAPTNDNRSKEQNGQKVGNFKPIDRNRSFFLAVKTSAAERPLNSTRPSVVRKIIPVIYPRRSGR